jgi:hypothetical protein
MIGVVMEDIPHVVESRPYGFYVIYMSEKMLERANAKPGIEEEGKKSFQPGV